MNRLLKDPDIIKRLRPFSWFSEAQLAWVLPKIQHRTYAARTPLVRGANGADGLYVVLSGRAQVIYVDSEGREFISRFVGPHDFFGELGLFDNEEFAASVRSAEPCELIYIPRNIVLECLAGNPQAAMCMLQTVTKRLCQCERKLAHLALNDVYERVAAVLLEHARETNSGWLVPIGSEQIAGLVGASREMVSRVITRMVREGVARKHKRSVVILDRQALSERSGPRWTKLQLRVTRDPLTRLSELENTRAVQRAG